MQSRAEEFTGATRRQHGGKKVAAAREATGRSRSPLSYLQEPVGFR